MSIKLTTVGYMATCVLGMAALPINALAGNTTVISVDLSSGTLTNSRFSNGYLAESSPTSFTLAGSDGGFYYPGTTTTYTIPRDSFNEVLQYVEKPTAVVPWSIGAKVDMNINYFEQTADMRSYLAAANVPDNGALNDGKWGLVALVTMPILTVRYEYDAIWNSDEVPGWDSTNTPLGDYNPIAHVKGVAVLNTFRLTQYDSTLNWAWPNAPFSFFVRSSDNMGGRGYLTVSNLRFTGEISEVTAAVSLVPEPENYAMLLAGLGLLGVVVHRRALI